jgi:hypothetical protein
VGGNMETEQRVMKRTKQVRTIWIFLLLLALPYSTSVVLANEKTVNKKTENTNTVTNFINDVIALLPKEISDNLSNEYDCINNDSQIDVSDKYWNTNRIDKDSFKKNISTLKLNINSIDCSTVSSIIKIIIEIGSTPSYYDPFGDGLKKNLKDFNNYQLSNKLIISYDGYDKTAIDESLNQLFETRKYKLEEKYPRLVLIAANLLCYIWVNNANKISVDKIALLREPFKLEFNNSARNNQINTTNVPRHKNYKSPPITNANSGNSINSVGGGIDIVRSPSRGSVSYGKIGNTTFGSDGTSYTRIGNTTFGSDGTSYSRIGNTTFGSDGTSYTKIGSTTFGSDGTSYTRIGNTTFGSDGSSCNKIGSFTFCQ